MTDTATTRDIPEWLIRLREICLQYPEATEQGGIGDPTFRVKDKTFAMQHGMNGRPSLWCKAQPGVQQGMVEAEPERFFVPPYVGQHGWVGAWLDVEQDWDELGELIAQSYRMTAPKRLADEWEKR